MNKKQKYLYLKLFLGFAGLLLFIYTFTKFPINSIFITLKQLSLLEIILLIFVNITIEFTLSGRWWVFLKHLSYPVPYIRLSFYKLAAIAISYATPGPQFGGEPYQIYVLNKNHKIPKSAAFSSIILERLFELTVNFSFLFSGLLFIANGHNLSVDIDIIIIAFSGIVFILPTSILLLMVKNKHPFYNSILFVISTIRSFVKSGALGESWLNRIKYTEGLAANTLRQSPKSTISAIFFSLLNWAGLVGEFWLLYFLLGLNLSPLELITLLVSARLAFLLPIPAGLGTLEASQILALSWLNFEPGIGISACLIIRARDLFFVLAGLLTMQITILEKPWQKRAKQS